MAVKIYNKRFTRQFETQSKPAEFMTVRANQFAMVPEKFTHDLTFINGVQAGDIEVFETKAEGEAIERKAQESEPKAVKKRVAKIGAEA